MTIDQLARKCRRAIGPSLVVAGTLSSLAVVAIAVLMWVQVPARAADAPATKPSEAVASQSERPASAPAQTGSAASGSSATPAPASGQGNTGTGGGGSGDPTANLLTAISVIVAVVTLLMTIGLTVLGYMVFKMAKGLEDLEERNQESDRALLVATALARAKRELANWLGTQRLTNAGSLTEELGRHLEELRADDADLRFDAFVKLSAVLRHHKSELADVARYCQACQELAIDRLQRDEDGNRRRNRDVHRMIDKGLWCLLFDPGEMERFKRRMEAQ